MTTIEVMRKALEALEHAEKDAADFQRINTDQTGAAITAIRAELERLEAAEPVAWMHEDGRVVGATTMQAAERDGGAMKSSLSGYKTPLYTAPIAPAIPALTPQDIVAEADDGATFGDGAHWAYALAAERAGVQIKD